MQEIVQFLVENVDVLLKVKEGTASLIGVSSDETKAILDVFFNNKITPSAYYWA